VNKSAINRGVAYWRLQRQLFTGMHIKDTNWKWQYHRRPRPYGMCSTIYRAI